MGGSIPKSERPPIEILDTPRGDDILYGIKNGSLFEIPSLEPDTGLEKSANTSFSPVLVDSAGDVLYTKTTNLSYYCTYGDLVFAYYNFNFTTSGTPGSGIWRVTLPPFLPHHPAGINIYSMIGTDFTDLEVLKLKMIAPVNTAYFIAASLDGAGVSLPTVSTGEGQFVGTLIYLKKAVV